MPAPIRISRWTACHWCRSCAIRGKTVERDLFWRYQQNNQEVLRRGNWKYIHYGNRDYLFDLAQDQREQANLWRLQPDIAQRLKSDFARWSNSMLPYDSKNQRRST